MEICLYVGISLVICGLIIMMVTRKLKSSKRNPPPLPARRVYPSSGRTAIVQQETRRIESVTLNTPLPARRSPTVLTPAVSNRMDRGTARIGYGPRGIRPDKFPVCPTCKRQNEIGKAQEIFWDSDQNAYYCTKGHKFASNGKFIF